MHLSPYVLALAALLTACSSKSPTPAPSPTPATPAVATTGASHEAKIAEPGAAPAAEPADTATAPEP
ncbi:MAG: hypothetical protein EP329_11850, partial [Deltaproteobacteria bacterium]